MDKENKRFQREAKYSKKLLEEGEGLVAACKQKMIKKTHKIQELKSLILKKDSLLESKKTEISKLENILARNSDGSNTSMKSYIISSKLKNVKNEIRRLRNEKLNLEASEFEYSKEIDNLESRLSEMKKREKDEVSEVQSLLNKVGTITDKIKTDIETHSMITNNRDKLQTVLNQEVENKKKLLEEVSLRRKLIDSHKLKSFIDTRTMKPTDWNKIEDNASQSSEDSRGLNSLEKFDQKMYKTVDEKTYKRSITKQENLIDYRDNKESKAQNSEDNEFEKNTNLSMISFDAD